MNQDERCCGTGTCIIDADGLCWCGQRWDGEKMGFAERPPQTDSGTDEADTDTDTDTD
jgi:hypothetical protein